MIDEYEYITNIYTCSNLFPLKYFWFAQMQIVCGQIKSSETKGDIFKSAHQNHKRPAVLPWYLHFLKRKEEVLGSL